MPTSATVGTCSSTGWIAPYPGDIVTTTSTGSVFSVWISDATTTRTDTIFTNWISCNSTSTSTQVWSTPSATDLAQARRLDAAERERYAQERKERERELRRANRKALLLLLMLMSPDQRAEFRKHGHFHVIGGKTGQRYRIRRGTIGNVDVLDGKRVKHRLCAHPTGVPEFDVLAAQLLHLQEAANEERFVKIANIHPAVAGR